MQRHSRYKSPDFDIIVLSEDVNTILNSKDGTCIPGEEWDGTPIPCA